MAVVRNDMAAGGPADLCIARTTFHRLRYTAIYICTYTRICMYTFMRAYIFMQNSPLCTPPFFTCVCVYVYVRTAKRIRCRVCTETGFIVLSTNTLVRNFIPDIFTISTGWMIQFSNYAYLYFVVQLSIRVVLTKIAIPVM